MDEETKAHLDAMEAHLMGRINTLQEQMLDRFRGVDIALASHTELMRSNNTLLTMLVATITDHGKRITGLENKP
jgi:hypothetical protein